MPQVAVRLALSAVLLAAAALKLIDARSSRAALATFGLRSERSRRAAWPALIAAEVALAVAIGAGSQLASYLAAGLLLALAAALALALRHGHAGAPCGCFGARSRVNRGAVARALVLAAGFAALPSIPAGRMSTDGWLAVGLGAALVMLAALAVAVLALAREVGMLRLALGPQAALEIPQEGPELGGRTELVARLPDVPDGGLGLAVFTSDGCALCTALAPALELLAGDPLLAVATFDAERDADAWRALDVPGSPFAVAVDGDGVVLAKGTFNSLAQLDGLLAAAERRAGVRAHA
jgi:hypothetical protein